MTTEHDKHSISWDIILVVSLVGNIARSELTRLKCKWTAKWKWKGKGVVDITHPFSSLA